MNREKTRILAISDEVVPFIYSGRIRDRFADVDMVIGCGDLPFYYLEFVVTMLDVPLYYVHGNHDHERQYMSDGRVATRAEGCISIDGELNSENGLLMAGLGGSIRYKTEGEHQYSDSEMTSRMRRISHRLLFNRYRYGRYLDLLIAHSPPFGIHDLKDPAHIGFRSFLKFMDDFRPKLLLHGHCHVYRGDVITLSKYKETQVVNVYPYRLIDYHPLEGFTIH
ncbi:MAG TPA: metallophosphoesterase [Anaerolineales bacterium]|nr:metallophosphoesterase [Anaerolineales bacterium]